MDRDTFNKIGNSFNKEELFSLYDSCTSCNSAEDHLKKAFAGILLGKHRELQGPMDFLRSADLKGFDLFCFAFVSGAYHSSFLHDYDGAIREYRKLGKYARKYNIREYVPYSLALIGDCQAMKGNIYYGLDLIRKAAGMPCIPEDHREFFNFLEVRYLLFTSNLELVRIKSKEIPKDAAAHINLIFEVSAGNWSCINQLVSEQTPEWAANSLNNELLATTIVIVSTVLGDSTLVSLVRNSWVKKVLEANVSRPDDINTAIIAKLALSILGFHHPLTPEETKHKFPWMGLFRFNYLNAILASLKNKTQAKTIIQSELTPLCLSKNLAHSFYPYIFNNKFYPENAWTKKLGEYLELGDGHKRDRTREMFIFNGRELVYAFNGKEIQLDLQASPQSRKLISILAGPKGLSIRKEQIHTQLTSSRYSPALHDQRIIMLFKRLRSKLEKASMPVFWDLPRDNTAVLLYHIDRI